MLRGECSEVIMSSTLSGRKSAELTTMDTASTSSFEKDSVKSSDNLISDKSQDFEKADKPVVANMEAIALEALHVDDDPTLNPWTFRMFFLGKHLPNADARGNADLKNKKVLGSPHLAQLLQPYYYSSRKVSRCPSSF